MIIIEGEKNVEDETTVLVWRPFGTDDHGFNAIHTGLIHSFVSSTHSVGTIFTHRRNMDECQATGRLRVRIASSFAIAKERLGTSYH